MAETKQNESVGKLTCQPKAASALRTYSRSSSVSMATGTEEVSRLVGLLYDALLMQYKGKDSEKTLRSLSMLCVRLVFCLYAESAGVFEPYVHIGEQGQRTQKKLFQAYLCDLKAVQIRKALTELFQVLNQKEDVRDVKLEQDNPILALFPYVGGGLFADLDIEIARGVLGPTQKCSEFSRNWALSLTFCGSFIFHRPAAAGTSPKGRHLGK